MLAGIVRRIVRRRFAELDRHDASRIIARFAEDIHFRFGGDHALSIDCHSRSEAERWFAGVFGRLPDLRFELEDVIVAGPPWHIRICSRYTARASLPGDRQLSYRGVQVARIRWGRVTEDLLYPDTQALATALS